MELSVVVPTLNSRDELASCLAALEAHAPDAEVIVVNGPSADGTTGMVQEHDQVDVLVEIADRTINAARNAGINRAAGDRIALVNHTQVIDEGWRSAVEGGLDTSDVVTGPTHGQLADEPYPARPESIRIKGREVNYFNPGNVAFRRGPLDELDGFDEYLSVGGARDMAHRLAGQSYSVSWRPDMRVRREVGADGGQTTTDWAWKYRSLAYRLTKNYGLRPTVVGRILRHGGSDCLAELRRVTAGDSQPSNWLASGRDVLRGMAGGLSAGLVARRKDRTRRRNPSGRTARADRAVTVYDWR